LQRNLNITQVLDKIQNYMRKLIQNVNRMPRNRLPRLMKNHTPEGRRNQGKPLKRLLDMWDRNGSTSRPAPWLLHDDDDDDYDDDKHRNSDVYNFFKPSTRNLKFEAFTAMNEWSSMLWRAFIL
jgi:hypothetical protein